MTADVATFAGSLGLLWVLLAWYLLHLHRVAGRLEREVARLRERAGDAGEGERAPDG